MTGHSINRTLIRNDLRKSPGTNLALLAIITLSAFLLATGAMVGERLLGSITALFDQAKPPHFLQMHVGDLDLAALERFAASHPEITDWQIEQLLNVDSSRIGWTRPGTDQAGDLSSSLIDNGFVTQNTSFDHLLAMDGTIPTPDDGQLWAPIAYRSQFGLAAGDELAVHTNSGVLRFEIVGFVRDAQMASSMASSTRFVISPGDWTRLAQADGAQPESIIEYRLTDAALAADFQRAYTDPSAGLPTYGPAVTYSMILLLNALGEGLMAAVLIFISALVMGIAMISLRFVIMGTLTDEVCEIGTMKAIGLPNRQIKSLYFAKYSILTLIGCGVGGVSAVLATQLLTRSIQTNFTSAPLGWASLLVPLGALGAVYLMVRAICQSILGRIDGISVVNALVHGSTLSERQIARQARRQAAAARRVGLANHGGRGLNLRLAWSQLMAERGRWALIPAVFGLTMMLIALPANLLLTLNSPRMASYLGVPQADLSIIVQFVDNPELVHNDILVALQADGRVVNVRDYATVLFQVQSDEGWQRLPTETGDYSGSTISYLTGTAPEQGQIALSIFNARDLGVGVGDELKLRLGDQQSSVTVSGTYQDMTNGGFTAKMATAEHPVEATRFVSYLDAAPGVDLDALAAAYRAEFPDAKVTPMDALAEQTLSHVVAALNNATVIAAVLGLAVAALLTTLFMRLQLARDRGQIGVLSAIGFTTAEVRGHYLAQTLVCALAGLTLGIAVTVLGGGRLLSGLLSAVGLGIAQLEFLGNPILIYGPSALALTCLAAACAAAATARLRRANLITWIREG